MRISLAVIAVGAGMLLSSCGGGGTSTDTAGSGGSGGSTQAGNAPAIFRVDTNIGPVAGGTHIFLLGSHFDPAVKVFVAGVQCPSVVFHDQSQLEAVTPAHAEGTFNVSVTNPDGLSAVSANSFRYVDIYVSSITPSTGPSTGGTNVVMTGKGFTYGTPGVSEAFYVGGGVAGAGLLQNVVVDSDSQLHGTVSPSSPGIFPVKFVLQVDEGVSQSGPATFTVTQPFSLGNPSPNSGAIAGGTAVAISGQGIYVTGSSMEFDGLPATECKITGPSLLMGSGVTLTCKAPPHAAGTVDITVRNPDNTAATLTGAFTYQ